MTVVVKLLANLIQFKCISWSFIAFKFIWFLNYLYIESQSFDVQKSGFHNDLLLSLLTNNKLSFLLTLKIVASSLFLLLRLTHGKLVNHSIIISQIPIT